MARRKGIDPNLPTQEQVIKFEMLSPMLTSMHNEMKELSKKKQDGIVSPLKVKMINRILEDIKEILSSDPSVSYLDLLDEETLPQNSDAVLILGQFNAAMAQFRKKYYGWDNLAGEYRWVTQ